MENEIQSKLMEYLDGIEKGVVDLAPQAYEVAKNVAHMSAIGHVVVSAFVFVILIIVGIVFWRHYVAIDRTENSKVAEAHYPALIFTAFLFVVFSICTLINVSQWANWIGIFDPEAALALKVYNSVFPSS